MLNDTIEVLPQNTLDEAALDDHLRDRLSGYAGGLAVRQFPGGYSNPTYALSALGDDGARHEYVLRKRPAGQLLPSAHQVDREYRVMRALANTPVPVPRTRFLCEDPAVLGQSFFLMDRVEGHIFGNPSMPGATPARRAAVYAAMIDTLANLHAVDPVAAGLGDFGKPDNFLGRLVDRWVRQYKAAQTDDVPEMDALADWLQAHLPPPRPAVLMHGDFRLGNLIIDTEAPRVKAVLDWELSTLGDPICDLAYVCLAYHLYEAPIGWEDADWHALGIPPEGALIERYCALRELDAVPHWDFYVAVNLFKLAAIAQGAYKRALDGIAPAAGLSRKQNVQTRARMAWTLVSKPSAAAP